MIMNSKFKNIKHLQSYMFFVSPKKYQYLTRALSFKNHPTYERTQVMF